MSIGASVKKWTLVAAEIAGVALVGLGGGIAISRDSYMEGIEPVTAGDTLIAAKVAYKTLSGKTVQIAEAADIQPKINYVDTVIAGEDTTITAYTEKTLVKDTAKAYVQRGGTGEIRQNFRGFTSGDDLRLVVFNGNKIIYEVLYPVSIRALPPNDTLKGLVKMGVFEDKINADPEPEEPVEEVIP